MNEIQKLIHQHCPNGVEYKKIGDIGVFYGGLSGKSKNDFTDGNAKFITYMNIYNNLSININIKDKVKIAPDEKQKTIKLGDILFTGSSENIQECGMSSVLCEEISEEIYLNSFCFGYRLNNPNMLIPGFSKYLFRSDTLRDQIKRTASGVTRFNVSKKKMAEVIIPIPPLPIQEEIVKILDTFTDLQTELEAQLQTELQLRQKQYKYYRDKLLSFENDGGGGLVEYKTLGEIMNLEYGTNLPQSKRIEGNYKVYGSNGVVGSHNTFFVAAPVIIIGRKGSAGKLNFVEENCCPIDTAFYSVMKTKDNLKFIFYYLQMLNLEKMRIEGGVPGINRNDLYNLKIPIPPLEEQERIVGILDKFDELVSDISLGIPAEIQMRKKQYEYYRDRLLRFEEAL
ncbi:restriction endonuclease subunit S [Helicobacter cappadocius]|uniref:Restriction endonuclease subunit S n=1 Tax=Helicobacter cappadocius TaxID=3063998 RepID=A0AA90PSR6_9HELI|nr:MULTISPECIES: restriction endonuclease subunit S [unclassified Helicobacter]MDO7253559.1 restriction endonuclease subunit S [Helicobacter sp. faydin-H75]MDP2539487.1 restriction endonuclease subunit S [Helicobacter sp. faydin-H76]